MNTKQRPPPQLSIPKLIEKLSHRYSSWQVFSDFVEMSAISISNAVDVFQAEKREARYMEIVKRYKPDEVQQFPKMLGELVNSLEEEPTDVLGKVFHDLELHNKWTGQFFTPQHLADALAMMTLGDKASLEQQIAESGFITLQEPACGSGVMVISAAKAMKAGGVNFQQHLHVTAVDVDGKCCHMAYLQFSLLHIPAVVVHGNTLSGETWGKWYTPAHILGFWDSKLRRREVREPLALSVTTEPTSQAIAPIKDATQLTLF